MLSGALIGERRSGILRTLMLLFVTAVAYCSGQTTLSDPPGAATDSLTVLRQSLSAKYEDLAALRRMLDALNGVDSVYRAHCPSWVVLDEDLRQRILRLLRMRYSESLTDTSVIVMTNPRRTEILELRAAGITMGRRDVRVNLGDSLHTEILEGHYPKRVLEDPQVIPRGHLLFGYTPRFAALSVSAFRATLLFHGGWGVDVKLGDEDIGYHFWSTGSLQAMAIFEQLKLGIIAPIDFGNTQPDRSEPLSIRGRRLTGSKGVAFEYDYPFGSEQISVHFKIGEIRGLTNPGLLADQPSIFSLHTVAQLTYSRQEAFDFGRHLVTFKGGIGYHQIAEGAFLPDGTLAPVEKQDFVSPVLDVDYVHQGEKLYGAGVQYYSAIIFARCWVELVRDFLFLDLKYYAPVGRDPKPWEQPYFFMISPRIQVVY